MRRVRDGGIVASFLLRHFLPLLASVALCYFPLSSVIIVAVMTAASRLLRFSRRRFGFLTIRFVLEILKGLADAHAMVAVIVVARTFAVVTSHLAMSVGGVA
jgi:hypothetical protein